MNLLNKHNFAVAEFASQEESRYSLKAIYVGETATVATNGHYLVRVSTPTASKPETFPVVPGFTNGGTFKPLLLSVDAAKEIEKAIPRKVNIPVLKHACLAYSGDTVNIAVTDLESPKVFTPRPVTGNFPAWDSIIPMRRPVFEITVDPTYLAQLCKAAAKFTESDKPSIRLQFWGSDRAMRLDAKNSETGQGWTAMLMPMRGGDTHGAGNLPDAKEPRIKEAA